MPITLTITGDTAQQAANELTTLASLFSKQPAPAPAKDAAKGEAARAETKPSAQPATAGETSSSAAPAAAPASAEKPAGASAEGAKFEYDTLKKAVHKLAGVNAEACVAINKQFGVKTMKELAEDKWPAAYEAVTAKLAELGVK